jgi:hypothetical protein
MMKGPLIDRVYVSPTSAGWFHELTKAMLRKYGLDKAVTKSDLAEDPVW